MGGRGTLFLSSLGCGTLSLGGDRFAASLGSFCRCCWQKDRAPQPNCLCAIHKGKRGARLGVRP